VNNYCDRLGFLAGLTVMVLAAQTAVAAENKITDIELNKEQQEIELKLNNEISSDSNSSFFTLRNGNTIEANLLNTKLDLPEGNSYRQEKPFKGIEAIEVHQLDGEHTQIIITTESDIASENFIQQHGKEIILSLAPEAKFPVDLKQIGKQAIKNLKNTYKSAFDSQQTKGDEKSETLISNSNNSDVLVPNPEIVVSDNGTKIYNSPQAVSQAASPPPTTLPRAVAPPVGDMAVSNINSTPDTVDLGSGAIVPRLVLRDAPVREVLSLLARSAGLNIVFTASSAAPGATGDAAAGAAAAPGDAAEPTVSLDLENQPVQEVFNSVLLVSGLNANRKGNIIYVGKQLPAQARNLVSRTIRLNQVNAENAALYLASQGAKGKRLTTEVKETVDPETGKVVQRVETQPQLSDLDGGAEDEGGTEALLLKGLQVATDSRLNAITLVGEPRKVEIATSFITQLDARRRQVAVNVKVIDVNLLNQDIFNSSFSFGVNDSFFVQDNGSATLRFGESSPASANDLNSPLGRVSNPPAITNPYVDEEIVGITGGANTFLDLNNTTSIPGTAPGLIDGNTGETIISRDALNFFNRIAGISSNPGRAGITDFTFAEDGTITLNEDGTFSFEAGTEGTATSALPSLFQYPDKFLSLLEAKVTSGNAKILTDPTLMVQEGQQGTVKLVQKIVESVKTEIDGDSGARTITPQIGEAGLSLTVNVERIDDNGFISMSVSPKVSSVGATQNFDSGDGAVNLLNLLSEREVSSGLVRLRDGQTLILSGIIQDQEKTTVSKVPILGDIPLLGSLFRSTDKANQRAEVIVLLTPQIVDEGSNFGYNYTPGKESREVLQREGMEMPGN
jgi:type IV pilus assembly protein PilQ